MSLTTFRHALRPQRELWRHLLLSLAVVTTIVASLLAMHSLNVEHAASESSLTADTAMDHHGAGIGTGLSPTSIAGDCGDPCAPGHLMTTMGCILALLVSVLLVGVIRVIAWQPVRNQMIGFTERSRTPRLPVPPSLYALCISRT